MKTNKKYISKALICGASLMLWGCAQEEINMPYAGGIPQASDYQISISVDDLNNVELNILDKNGNPAVGVYPVWYVNNSSRPSTALTYRDLITVAGDYPVEMKVGNSNGVSEGSVTGTIVIAKTIFDFSPYMRGFTNGESKEWGVDGETPGHMGCGETGDNPTGWWSASVNQKEAEGVYENTLTFAYTGSDTTGDYTFDPGTAGTFYVNTGVHSLAGYEVNNPDDGDDFRVSATVKATTFSLVAEGPSLYLTLPSDTPFPYVPSEAAFSNPKYRISAFEKNKITLVQELEGISWQYIITPKGEVVKDVTTTGFKYDSPFNLWKDADVGIGHSWFEDDGWNELGNQPTVTLTDNKGIVFHTPVETGNTRWQGQVHVHTNIPVSAEKTYDFSCNVNVPKAGAVTVKVQKLGEDGTFIVEDPVEVEPNGSIVWFADMKGFDGDLKIAFDFAGFGDCDISVSDIVFKEHGNDDGTVIPAAAMAPAISDEDNLFANYEVVKYSTWFADSSWSDANIQQPEIVFFEGGYSFIAPEGIGSDQWQGQVHVWTNVATSSENKYDFMLTLESDQDIKNVTIKIQKGDGLGEDAATDDGVYFKEIDRVNVEAGTPYLYFFKGREGIDTKNLQVCMDYAGAPGKANITVSDIRMQVSKE